MALGNRSVGSSWSLRGLSRGPRGRRGRSGHSGRNRRNGNNCLVEIRTPTLILMISVLLVGMSLRVAPEDTYLR